MVDMNTSSLTLILNCWKSSQTTDKYVYISLAVAAAYKFDWEKIGKGALEQPTAISMDK